MGAGQSHETIYKTLFIQTRGALKKELQQCLRSGRVVRRSRTSSLKRKDQGKSRMRYLSVKVSHCQTCGQPMRTASETLNFDCGGDCLSCMALHRDPQAIDAVKRLTGGKVDVRGGIALINRCAHKNAHKKSEAHRPRFPPYLTRPYNCSPLLAITC